MAETASDLLWRVHMLTDDARVTWLGEDQHGNVRMRVGEYRIVLGDEFDEDKPFTPQWGWSWCVYAADGDGEVVVQEGSAAVGCEADITAMVASVMSWMERDGDDGDMDAAWRAGQDAYESSF